jgi:hypothetical protein
MRVIVTLFCVMVVVFAANCGGKMGSGGMCCRVCKESRACGDACIPFNRMCMTPPGCACNG